MVKSYTEYWPAITSAQGVIDDPNAPPLSTGPQTVSYLHMGITFIYLSIYLLSTESRVCDPRRRKQLIML